MWGFLQLGSKWDHVSISEELQIEYVMDGYKMGPKNNCLQALPMYWLYQNLRRQVIWESVTSGCVQKSIDVILSMFLSIVHSLLFGKDLASVSKLYFLSHLSMYSWRFQMGPLYGVCIIECHQSLCR